MLSHTIILFSFCSLAILHPSFTQEESDFDPAKREELCSCVQELFCAESRSSNGLDNDSCLDDEVCCKPSSLVFNPDQAMFAEPLSDENDNEPSDADKADTDNEVECLGEEEEEGDGDGGEVGERGEDTEVDGGDPSGDKTEENPLPEDIPPPPPEENENPNSERHNADSEENEPSFICGRTNDFGNLISPKIYAEDADDSWTQQGDFPWTLLIKYIDTHLGEPSPQVLCGASLVLPNVALTAAHCVYRKKIENLVVYAGEWSLEDEDESIAVQERRALRMLIHPKFDQRPVMNDVAIIVLEEPFTYSVAVNTVCMPDGSPVVTSACYATGWGEVGLEKRDHLMRKAKMPLLDHHDCQAKFRAGPLGRHFRLHKSFLCAGGEDRTDTCKGDGGGPLVCRSQRPPYSFYLMGITSWGVGCGHKGVPGAYTNVTHFMEWFYSSLWGNSAPSRNPSDDGDFWSYRSKP